MSNSRPTIVGRCRCGGDIIEALTQWRCPGCGTVLRRDDEMFHFSRESAIQTFQTGATPWFHVEIYLPGIPFRPLFARLIAEKDQSIYIEFADKPGELRLLYGPKGRPPHCQTGPRRV